MGSLIFAKTDRAQSAALATATDPLSPATPEAGDAPSYEIKLKPHDEEKEDEDTTKEKLQAGDEKTPQKSVVLSSTYKKRVNTGAEPFRDDHSVASAIGDFGDDLRAVYD